MWYWQKDRHIDQWNTTQSSEINPYLYGHMISDKGAEHIQSQSFQQTVLGKLIIYMPRVKLNYLTSHAKNSKWIHDLNGRIKMGSKLNDIEFGNDLLDRTTRIQATK